MSIIRKQPYIEKVIAQLNTQELTSLLAVMNSQETANTSAEFGNLPLTAITPVIFHFPDGYYKTGILLKNTNVLTLICYNSKQQDLELFDLDNTNYKANKVYEYCSISELRRVINDNLYDAPAPEPYELTPEELANVLEGSESVVVDLNEAGTKLQAKIDEDIMSFILPVEVALSDIIHTPSTTNTIITVAPDVMDTDNGYHIYLEIEGTGTHYGADFTVFPYNEAVCLTVFNMLYDGNVEECFASFDSNGQLNIDIPVVMTPESQTTKIHYKRII